MTLRKTFFFICLIASVLCTAAGYAIAGNWIGVILAILMGPIWLFTRKYPDSWLLLTCLLMSVGLAVAGRLIGASPLLMILGSGLALAVWDLLFLDTSLRRNSSGEQTRQYEYRHLQSLALALGSGLLITLLGRLLNLQIPFIILMLLIAFTLFALDRVWGYLRKTGKV
ncbi:MAG TPA: hypothetical protein VFQ13_12390 [Anaerolineales bacterium]|nr:hypothetical protein [Anaerolineales bacterium]